MPPPPVLSAEIYVIPPAERYLIYAPLRKAAFVANARVVNLLADIKEGKPAAGGDPNGAMTEFLRHLEILDAGPEPPPNVPFPETHEPVSVTLFLTSAAQTHGRAVRLFATYPTPAPRRGAT